MRVVNRFTEGIDVLDQPATGIVDVFDRLNSPGINNGQEAVTGVIGERGGLVGGVGDPGQVTRYRVVRIVDRVAGRIGDLGDKLSGIACRDHAFSAGVDNTTGAHRERVAVQ